ncbi:MAG: SDR family oxidoreductase [Myxococcales bacterium]|nr:SDR family oxidoreductase [Myxococcales bacterium]
MRLKDKVAIVVGAGQTPGDTLGNGRATALLFAREGARVLVVDRDEGSAVETLSMIEGEGGVGAVVRADIADEAQCKAVADGCIGRFGRIDVLHNNVGIGTGDRGPASLSEEAFDHIMDVNLKGPWFCVKHVLPRMREQGGGSIINISSVAAVCATGLFAYKVSKAALNAMTHCLATGNAKYGIRVNGIMPGLMNTPMAIESIAEARGVPKQDLIAARDRQVPLKGKMGTAWDVAYAALFLACDESKFITGVTLPVDGGQSARIG